MKPSDHQLAVRGAACLLISLVYSLTIPGDDYRWLPFVLGLVSATWGAFRPSDVVLGGILGGAAGGAIGMAMSAGFLDTVQPHALRLLSPFAIPIFAFQGCLLGAFWGQIVRILTEILRQCLGGETESGTGTPSVGRARLEAACRGWSSVAITGVSVATALLWVWS